MQLERVSEGNNHGYLKVVYCHSP